ncbi:MAG TPA: S-layer homology domain-containing protein [Chondromyces sp.]|nr:S-layer homology domain-containing protein [Chondromyces sp.]
MIKRKSTLFLVICVLMMSLISPRVNYAAADDITGITLEKEMRAMIERGVLEGYGDGVYKPHEKVTRGQFATFLSRALKLPNHDQVYFKDVSPSSSLAVGIQNAYGAGLIDGYSDNTFRPGNLITREQMAKMVFRALEYLQVPVDTVAKDSAAQFADYGSISSQFREAVSVNVGFNIIKGYSREGVSYFNPKNDTTRDQAAAVIYRLLNTAEKEMEPVPVDPEPGTKFSVAVVQGDQLQVQGRYTTYENALKNWESRNDQVIMYGDRIIKMRSGIAVSIPTPSKSTADIYSDEALKKPVTYVVNDTELRYIDSDEEKVKVQIGDQIGYVKHEFIDLKPSSMIKDRSYYTVRNGVLFHYVYSNQSGNFASYSIGKAPSFLAEGGKYYSWDGHTFLNSNGGTVGNAYQYFQYLPARTKTQYTAAELNNYINEKMKELEQLYQQNPTVYARYKDATKRSKLIGIGDYLKKMESTHKVNALHILALASHESDHGMSKRAQEQNNLFGLRIYDDSPANDVYPTVEKNIDELLTMFWGKNYIPPTASYANGAVFGNKGVGFNVKYASDPYWGAKIAGHMYRIDQVLGGKEMKNQYTIGMTNIEGLNFRLTPEVTSTNKAFTYRNPGMPVAILDRVETGGRIWIKVISDDAAYNEVYVAGEYIDDLPIAK